MAQSLGVKHPNDPTVTTLEQPSAVVTPKTISDAQFARIGTPVVAG